MNKMKNQEVLSTICRDVLIKEANALTHYANRNDDALIEAINLIVANQGPLIAVGVGKSGHIAHKIASTMRSLGKPATFLHAAEASHGDLGIIRPDSTVLVLSNSGETTELSDVLHYCRANRISIISLTSNAKSTLARFSDVTVCYGETQEACINGLAPTTSTTLCLAIGDALAVGVSHELKIAPEDFRKWHPGGKLGARLYTIADLMKTGDDIPFAPATVSITEALLIMAESGQGAVILRDGDQVLGIVTDGDIRRHFETNADTAILEIASTNPVFLRKELGASEAAEHMAELGITSCVVGAPGDPIEGYIHIHDCLAAGGKK